MFYQLSRCIIYGEKKREYNNYCTKTKPSDSSAHYRRCRVIEPVIDTLRNHRRAILKKPDAAARRVRESRAGHLERRSDILNITRPCGYVPDLHLT